MACGSGDFPWTFPVLTVVELVEALEPFCQRGDITKNDFKQPTKNRWLNVFDQITSNIFVSDLFQENVFEQIELQRYQRVHLDDSHAVFKRMADICGRMRIVLSLARFGKFQLKDVVRPGPEQRLVEICSALVNYIRFNDYWMNKVFEKKQERDGRLKENGRLVQNIDETKHEISKLKSDFTELQKRKAESEGESARLKEEMVKKTTTYTEIHQQLTLIKATLEERKDENKKLKANIVESKAHHDRLSADIVSSPEKLKTELQKLLEKMESVDMELQNARAVKFGMSNEMGKREADINVIKECKEQMTRTKEVCEEITKLKKRLQEVALARKKAEEEREKKNNQLKVEEGQVENRKGEKSKLEQQLNNKIKAEKSKQETLTVKVTEKSSKMKALDGEILKQQQLIERLEKDLQQQKDEYKTKLEKLNAQQTQLLTSIDEYHRLMAEEINQLGGGQMTYESMMSALH